jgi:hypothetical protein
MRTIGTHSCRIADDGLLLARHGQALDGLQAGGTEHRVRQLLWQAVDDRPAGLASRATTPNAAG